MSGAAQARRWQRIAGGGGFIYSFNGLHSLFADTFDRFVRWHISHLLGHVLMERQDERVSLLEASWCSMRAQRLNMPCIYGDGRDSYDMRAGWLTESIFNTNSGSYRCPILSMATRRSPPGPGGWRGSSALSGAA